MEEKDTVQYKAAELKDGETKESLLREAEAFREKYPWQGAREVTVPRYPYFGKEILAKVLTVLTDDGIIVFNSVIAPKVSIDSHQLWNEACAELGLKQDSPTKIQLNNHHPITILRCRK